MALILPPGSRHRAQLEASGLRCLSAPEAAHSLLVLRIGVINLMPAAESYELLLLRALGGAAETLEQHARMAIAPVWIKLERHLYGSRDAAHLYANYRSFERAMEGGLAGLILTGAPIETLPFEAVRYWRELRPILERARAELTSTLGLCWGGLALAKLLEIEKRSFESKLFGSFALRALTLAQGPNLAGSGTVHCAQSRHAGIDDEPLEQAAAAGSVRLLAHGEATGYSVFESADGRFVMHLGHPEYDRERLVHEYLRDQAAGRHDVTAPHGVDLASSAALRSHGPLFFARWLERIAVHAAARAARLEPRRSVC